MNTFGWKKVFKFTFTQYIKSKTFIISTCIISALLLLMTSLMNILPGLLSGETSDVTDSAVTVKKIYLADNSGITHSSDYKDAIASLGIEFEAVTDYSKVEEYTETVKNSSSCLLITLNLTEDGYIKIYAARPADGSVNAEEAKYFADSISQVFTLTRLSNLGLDAKQTETALIPVTSGQSVAGEAEENVMLMMLRMIIPMISSVVLFIMIFAYGQIVAQSVALEKTSKVIELLLTSVKPLAVIIGKVLAMGLISLMQFLIFGFVGALGFLATMPLGLGITSSAAQQNTDMQMLSDAIDALFSTFSPFNIIVIILLFLLGFAFYALIAGLIGASVSRSEDLNSAMQPYAFLGVAGFYFAYFPSSLTTAGEGSSVLQTVSYYLPLSAPFALPSALLTGSVSAAEVITGTAILALFVILTAVFVARIYEQIILHSGNRLKINELFGLARSKK